MINVTRPNLPPLEELIPHLESIWESGILSNNGPIHQKLEQALSEYLGLEHLSLVCNATIGLMLAQEVLGVRGGEVITTPYSFVATANSIFWMNNKPVFVDVEAESACIDPALIEDAITENTKAIMPLHCYGNVAKVGDIADVSNKYSIPVIYDACHSFGIEDEGGSVLRHGDIAVVSFHATKVFSTFEGGVIVSPDRATKENIDRLKNFGFVDEEDVSVKGINGKLNEVSAAFGLVQLQHIESYVSARAVLDAAYRDRLNGVVGLRCLDRIGQRRHNYAYFPIVIEEEFPINRDALALALKLRGFNCRKYFYPLIPEYRSYAGDKDDVINSFPRAKSLSNSVLCLPLFPELRLNELHQICDAIESLSS